MAAEHPILVVDDDLTILISVAELLELEGYAVATAANGAEALEMTGSLRPGLVLLDMRMPVLDGWAYARAVRDQGLQPPIVIMTAAHDARRWADEIGADGFIAKPFEADALIAAVERIVGRPAA
ncbi:MAG: response regulator [Chloroflexi bacterium]|nr:response regulator [Chloroflexota bacterium]MBV9133112.1 response regulator [Chloroflexota bacterium]MBV9896867.1 response regulator [Chloroflexota bacterium]